MLNINDQKNLLKRVLVLDNNPTILDIMQEALIYEGFLVDIYKRTDNILLLIKQHLPDLIIVDFLLEGINGGEVCRNVKITLLPQHSGCYFFCLSAGVGVIRSLCL